MNFGCNAAVVWVVVGRIIDGGLGGGAGAGASFLNGFVKSFFIATRTALPLLLQQVSA